MDQQFITKTLDADGSSLVMRLEFAEDQFPFLLSVSSLLYDLELAHDLAVLLSYPQYKSFEFSRYFWYRGGRPLSPFHKLRTFAITKNSPLTLEVVVAAVGGIWILIQIFDKVGNWNLNKEKLKLEIEKLHKENALKDVEIFEKQEQLEEKLRQQHAQDARDQLVKRFEESPIRLTSVSIRKPDRSDG
jgi:hypothetical protein